MGHILNKDDLTEEKIELNLLLCGLEEEDLSQDQIDKIYDLMIKFERDIEQIT